MACRRASGEVGMIMRRLIWVRVWASCPAVAWAAPEPKSNASPVCLYESRTYSEGAFVCVQKSLMLTCVAENGRLLWKPAVDKDINDRCTAPTVQHYSQEPRPHAHRRHYATRRIHSLVTNSKCFVFNGREYCE